MNKMCFIVRESSLPYIKNVVTAMTDAIQESFDKECKIISCQSIDSAEIGDAKFIFVIGESFKKFKRLEGRYYIY